MNAMDAVNMHMAAINTRQRDRFAETIAFPFVHIEPNGEKICYQSFDDIPDLSGLPFARAEITATDLMASSGDLTVFLLTFQRYDEKDNPGLLVQGLWGVHRVATGWKVGWRQYLGEVGATSHPPLLSSLGGGSDSD